MSSFIIQKTGIFKFFLFWVLRGVLFVLVSCELSPPDKTGNSKQASENDSVVVADMLRQALDSVQTNYAYSIERALEARYIAELSGDEILKTQTNLQLGKLYFYKGLYDEATDCYISMKEGAEEINSTYWQAIASIQLGGVRLVLEDYKEAKGYFELGEKLLLTHFVRDTLIPRNIRMALHNNFGVIYSGLNELEMAEKELKKGLELYRGFSLEEHYSYVQLLNNIGDLYLKQNKHEESLMCFNEALELLKHNPNPLFESMIFNSLGRVCLKKQDHEQALNNFYQGFEIAKKVNGFSHLSHIAKGISESYEALNNADSALVYIQLKQIYKDSLQLDRTKQRIFAHEIMESFENERNLSSKQQSRVRIIAMVTASISALIVLIFYVKNKWRKRKIRRLEKEKLVFERMASHSTSENEKLKKNLEQIEKDLSDVSMHVLIKHRLIDDLKQKIESESTNVHGSEKTILELAKLLENKNNEAQLNDFEFYFGKIHPDFFSKLQEQYPNLSRNERRLSALLKLQMTTKEISSITGQSIRAIEIARTRLRKKLELKDSSTNLYDFFLNL